MKLFQATFATGILPVAAAEAIRVASAEEVAAKAAARFQANTTVFAPSVVVPAAPKVAGNDVGVVFRRAAAVAAPAATADSFQAILSAVRACAHVSEYEAAVAQAAVADGCATPAQRKLAEQTALIQRNLGKAAIALTQLQAAPAKAKASVMELPKAAPAVKAKVRAPIGFAAHVEAVKAAAARKAAAKAAYVAKTASVRKGKGGGSSRKIGRNVRKAAAKAVVAKAMALTAISRQVSTVETSVAPSAAADWARIVASMAKYPRASRHITGTVYETQYTDGTSEVRQFTFKGEFVVSSVLV